MSMRRLIVAVVLLALAAGVAGLLLTPAGQRLIEPLTHQVSRWCARQISAVVDAHLRPDFEFDAIAYSPPATVTLSGVRLTAEGTPIIRVDSLRIELAEVPRRGRPLLFKDLALTNPVVRLVPTKDGSLLGFDDFVKPGEGARRPDGGSTRLSDVLRIQTIRIDGGSVSYEPAGEPPMVLKPLTVDLERKPGDDAEWYAFEFDAALDPVVDLKAAARLNLDNGDLDLQPLTLKTRLTEQQYTVFTPSIQEVLAAHKIVGALDGSLKGTVGLGDTSRSDFEFSVTLADGNGVFGEFSVPIESLEIDASYRGRRLQLGRVLGNVFNGHVESTAWLDFGQAGSPFWAQSRGTDLKLQDLMHVEGEEAAAHTGDVTFNAELTGKLDDLPASLSGGGEVSVENGRLALVSLFQNVLSIRKKHEAGDRAKGTFAFGGKAVTWKDFEIVGRWVAIKGKGDVFYDGTLDLRVNAGPVERLEVVLGKVGDLLGKLTGGVVIYQVTGALKEPKVEVRPLGLGMKKKEDGEIEVREGTE